MVHPTGANVGLSLGKMKEVEEVGQEIKQAGCRAGVEG
jgi:hypothetical protein